MTNLDIELEQLKQAVIEMMEQVVLQLEKSKTAFFNFDVDLAEEIIHVEKRINGMELSIDRDCENIFALFNPVATDLRFVIAVLKINSDLERIADYAESIALYVLELEQPFKKKSLQGLKMVEMFDIAILMLGNISIAFEDENTILARKTFKKDKDLNKINKNASKVISVFVNEDPTTIRSSLFLFSTVRKLERIGDHIKNIAEEIIFHIEAKVLRHKKKKIKLN